MLRNFIKEMQLRREVYLRRVTKVKGLKPDISVKNLSLKIEQNLRQEKKEEMREDANRFRSIIMQLKICMWHEWSHFSFEV